MASLLTYVNDIYFVMVSDFSISYTRNELSIQLSQCVINGFNFSYTPMSIFLFNTPVERLLKFDWCE